jgi:hypothetical protein
MIRNNTILLTALALVLLLSSPAAAADGAGTPLFGGYVGQFYDHWMGMLKQQNGVVVFVLGIGAVSLFIITRGKWKKG